MGQAATAFSDHLKTLWQYPLPQHALSRLVYWLTRLRNRPIKNWMIGAFVRRFEVDLSEAAQTDPAAYPSFNAFFTRALRTDARPIDAEPEAVVCPADAHISQIGSLKNNSIIQAKDRDFTAGALLGDPASAERFANGEFVTLYLSPRDYHRVHMPVDGSLRHMRHIPGRLFSVNPPTVRSVPQLFARNERVVSFFETPAGAMALVLVGALNVGSIETAWAGELTPARGKWIRDWNYEPGEIQLRKGVEAGRFNMGSTVILLFSRGRVLWAPALGEDSRVRVGERLGTLRSG